MSTKQQDIWNIPYDRNPYFTGREHELRLLHDGFLANRSSSPVSQVLVGENGIGKTQIALEYACQYRDEYQAVFWIRADSSELLATELMSIADQLKLPARIGDDQEPVADAVKEWFATQSDRWLLIVDHLSDIADLSAFQAFLPEEGRGDILITTIHLQVPNTTEIVVGPMEDEEGIVFLLLRSSEMVHGMSLQSVDPAMIIEARKVVAQLNGHPLALELAAFSLESTDGNLSEYHKRFQTRLSHPIETTWSIFFEYIEQQSSRTADLLRFCSFFDGDIPLEIFFTPECSLALDETIDTMGMFLLAHPQKAELSRLGSTSSLNSLMAHPDVDALGPYFLAHRERAKNLFRLHHLVQIQLQKMCNEQLQRDYAERAVLAVSRLFPEEEFEVWETCQRYLSQALVCAALITRWHIDCPEAGFLLSETGAYLSARAQYVAARPFLEQALSIRKRILGADHPEVAQTLSNLGHLARKEARDAEARQCYQQALDILERIPDLERSEVITTLNDLGEVAERQEDTVLAETVYRRAVTMGMQFLGPADPRTIRSVGNLAVISDKQGNTVEAESGYKEALRLAEGARGPNHTATAQALKRLGQFYEKQGLLAQAEPLIERACTITEHQLGVRHPEVVALHTYLSTLRAMRREGR